MVAPPLHSPSDFFEFNVRYDRAIADRIHAAGGRLNVHCHGRVKAVIHGFAEVGADVFHCFEAPPMGDITPAEAKKALRGKVALEGNIQIADMDEKSPEDIRAETQALIRDCFDDGRVRDGLQNPSCPRKRTVRLRRALLDRKVSLCNSR